MRNAEIILHIGKKKTGKTTENLAMIREFVLKQNKPVIILDAGMQEEYNFAKNINLDDFRDWNKTKEHRIVKFQNAGDFEEFTEHLNYYVRNAVIFLEDATRYIGNIPTKPLRDLIYNNRNLGLDIIFTFHGVTNVPNELMKNADKIILRKTEDNFQTNTFKNKIVGKEFRFETAIKRITLQNKMNNNSFHSELIDFNE